MGTLIVYKRPDGQSVNGYLAEPSQNRNAPGMVVIQEWWGLNDQIKGVADKLAAAGYRALVPDLYRGKVALEHHEAEHLMNSLNFGDAAGQDVRGAVQYLKASGSTKVGVTGFCMGGALTLLAVVNVPELAVQLGRGAQKCCGYLLILSSIVARYCRCQINDAFNAQARWLIIVGRRAPRCWFRGRCVETTPRGAEDRPRPRACTFSSSCSRRKEGINYTCGQ